MASTLPGDPTHPFRQHIGVAADAARENRARTIHAGPAITVGSDPRRIVEPDAELNARGDNATAIVALICAAAFIVAALCGVLPQ